MPHVFKGLSQFRADRPWGAVDLGLVEGASVRLHWSDQPYIWHVNDGAEVFVVITGEVEMRYREGGAEKSVRLVAGDAFSPIMETAMWRIRWEKRAFWWSRNRALSDGRLTRPVPDRPMA